MALLKFSAKEMGKKLEAQKKAAAEKKIEEQKKKVLEDLERQRKEGLEALAQVKREEARKKIERERQLFLNSLMIECLDAALKTSQGIEMDPSDFEAYEDYLEAKGFYLEEQNIEAELIKDLEKKLNELPVEDISKLREKLLKILAMLEKLNWLATKSSIEELLKEKNVFLFVKEALLFLSYSLSYYNENQRDLFEDDTEFLQLIKFVQSIEKHETLIREYIPYSLDNFDELWFLKWDETEKDEIKDNWFNAKNLNWISSKSGKKFFDDLLLLINSKIEALADSLYFDAFEKNGQTILTLENGKKLKTSISLPDLLEIFDAFGYKKKVPKSEPSGRIKNLKISWSN